MPNPWEKKYEDEGPWKRYQGSKMPEFDPLNLRQKVDLPPEAHPGEILASGAKKLGNLAVEYAPAIGATIGTAVAPEAFLPALGAGALGGMVGYGARDIIQGKPYDPLGMSEEGGKQLAMGAIGGGLTGLGRKVIGSAPNWYQGALSGSGADLKKIPEIAETGLQTEARDPNLLRVIVNKLFGQTPRGIPISKTGESEVKANIRELSSAAEELRAPYSWEPISQDEILKPLRELRDFYSESGYPGPYVKPTLKVEKQFRSLKPDPMTLEQTQKMKSTDYKLLGDVYGELSPAQTESVKQLTRGAKEAIEARVPGLKELNEVERRQIDLEGAIQGAVLRASVKPTSSIPAHVGAAAATGKSTGYPVYWMSRGIIDKVLHNPEVNSKIAIALDMIRRRTGPSRVVNLTTGLRFAEPSVENK